MIFSKYFFLEKCPGGEKVSNSAQEGAASIPNESLSNIAIGNGTKDSKKDNKYFYLN
jgi:hypothetical protein